MPYAFIEKTPIRTAMLSRYGIEFSDFKLEERVNGSTKTIDGIIFDEVKLPRVLKLLASDLVENKRTQYEGINKVDIKRKNGYVLVSRSGTNIPNSKLNPKEVVKAITWKNNETNNTVRDNFIAETVKLVKYFNVGSFELNACRDRGADNTDDTQVANTFKVFVWRSKSHRGLDYGRSDKASKSELFGVRISDSESYWNIFGPSKENKDVKVISYNGSAVAELYGNVLYIFYPIDSAKIQNGHIIYNRILLEVLKLRGISEEIINAEIAKFSDRILNLKEEERVREPYKVDRWDAKDRVPNDAKVFIWLSNELKSKINVKHFSVSSNIPLYVEPKDYPYTYFLNIWGMPHDLKIKNNPVPNTLMGKSFKKTGSGTAYFLTEFFSERNCEHVYDEDENLISIISGKNIYIPFMLWSDKVTYELDGNTGSDRILKAILIQTLKHMRMNEVDRKTYLDKQKIKISLASKQKYIDLCSVRIDNKIKNCKNDVANYPSKIEEMQASIAKYMRAMDESAKFIFAYEENKKADMKIYEEEFDKLNSLPEIQSVIVQNTRIIVRTSNIFCEDPRSKKMHALGEFNIYIELSDMRVSIFNQTNKVTTHDNAVYNAPHVDKWGKPCYGTLADIIPQLLSSYELSTLVIMILQFLQSVNVNDLTGQYINKWPEYKV